MIFLRPYALYALALAVVPWLALVTPPGRNVPRVTFPALALLASRDARRRRKRRDYLRACVRTIIIVALALLWAAPQPDRAVAPRQGKTEAERQLPARTSVDATRILILDCAATSRAKPDDRSSAEYLKLALEQTEAANVNLVSYLEFAASDRALEGYDLVVVAGLASPSTHDLNAIRAYLDAAQGAVIIWADAQTNPDAWRVATSAAFQRDLQFRTIAPLDARSDNAWRLPRQETRAERIFKDAFPDFDGSRVDALPITRATICFGDGADVVLRDVDSQLPIYSQIAPKLYWFAASADSQCGALIAAPAFQVLVENVALFPMRFNDETKRQDNKKLDLTIPIWLALVGAIMIAAFKL